MTLVLTTSCPSIIAFLRPGEQDRYRLIRFPLSGSCKFGTEICTPGELFLRGTGDPYPGCLGDNDGVRLDSGELGERLRDLD